MGVLIYSPDNKHTNVWNAIRIMECYRKVNVLKKAKYSFIKKTFDRDRISTVFIAEQCVNIWLPALKHSVNMSETCILSFPSHFPYLPWVCLSLSVCRHRRVSEPWHLQSDLHQPERGIQMWMPQRLPNGSNHRSLQSCWWESRAGGEYSLTH